MSKDFSKSGAFMIIIKYTFLMIFFLLEVYLGFTSHLLYNAIYVAVLFCPY